MGLSITILIVIASAIAYKFYMNPKKSKPGIVKVQNMKKEVDILCQSIKKSKDHKQQKGLASDVLELCEKIRVATNDLPHVKMENLSLLEHQMKSIISGSFSKKQPKRGLKKDNAEDWFLEYSSKSVITTAHQVLETTHIMHHSKNVDVIESRMNVLVRFMEILKALHFSERYKSDVQIAIEKYKTLHYEKDLYQWQLNILIDPYGFDISYFSAKSLHNGFFRFLNHQMDEIESLQRDHAIRNRYKKIVSVFDEFMPAFNREWQSSSANKFKIEKLPLLEKLKQEIISNKNQHQ